MSFILRLTIAIVILFLLEFILVKKIRNSFNHVFNNQFTAFTKWFLGSYLVFLNLFPVLLLGYWGTRYFFGMTERLSIENSLFDWFVIYPFWTLALFTFQTIVLFLLYDLIKVILRFFTNKERLKNIFLKLNFVTIVFFFLYVPARIIYDYNTVSVRVTEIKKEGLNDDLAGKKIVLVGDIHTDHYTDDDRLNNFIDKINSLNPDLVLIAGDMISSTPNYISKSAEMMGKIKSKHGIYSCIGDHDNWSYRGDSARSRRELKEALDSVGVEFIHNDNREIVIGDARIGVSFVTHTYSEQVENDSLKQITTNCKDCDLKMFLTHQPRQFLMDIAKENNYDLYLAGHTHGGQLSILFPFITLSPTLIETKYVRGDFYLDNLMVVVTRGLGMSIAPIRYNSTPEITVIVPVKK